MSRTTSYNQKWDTSISTLVCQFDAKRCDRYVAVVIVSDMNKRITQARRKIGYFLSTMNCTGLCPARLCTVGPVPNIFMLHITPPLARSKLFHSNQADAKRMSLTIKPHIPLSSKDLVKLGLQARASSAPVVYHSNHRARPWREGWSGDLSGGWFLWILSLSSGYGSMVGNEET